MEETLPKCHVCEGTNYYLDAGFYFCSECNTQSVSHCESFLDYQQNTSNVHYVSATRPRVKKTKEKEKKTGHTVEWTSWEGYNFILKGMVEELISLGARPELKNVVLQLWVKYLAKLEVAFTSKTELLLPKIGLNQTAKDYMIIWGQIKEKNRKLLKLLARDQRRKPWRNNGKWASKPVHMSDKLKKRVSKSQHVTAEYEKIKEELAYNQDILSQIDDRLRMMETAAKEIAKRKKAAPKEVKTVRFSKRMESAFAKLQELKEKKKTGGTSNAPEEEVSYNDRSIDPTILSRQRLLSLILLGLLLIQDDLQISDVIRWIREGHLSYDRVAHFLPEGMKFTESDLPVFTVGYEVTYKVIIHCVASVVELIGVQEVPASDFLSLVRRYIVELELPSEIVDHVEKLLVKCSLQNCCRLVNREGLAMAFIIIVLKTHLGLDGQTEHYNSVFARKINKLIEVDEERELQRKLFVWDDWVRYIACRKAIVMNEHLPTRDKCTRDLSTPAYTYSQWWHHGANKDPTVILDRKECYLRKAHVRRIKDMRKTCESLPHLPQEEGQTFPPALTPQASYLQEIRAHWCSPEYRGSGVLPTKVLTNTQALTSFEYLFQPDRIIKFAERKGLKVTVVKSRASADEGIPGIKRMDLKHRGFRSLVYFAIGYDGDPPPKNNTRRKVLDYQKLTREAVLIPKKSLSVTDTVVNGGEESEQKLVAISGNRNGRSDSSDGLVLFTPFSDYWFYCMKNRQPEAAFEKYIEPELSESFRWLLSECSNILEMKNIELYEQLMLAENLYFKNIDLSELEIKVQYSDWLKAYSHDSV